MRFVNKAVERVRTGSQHVRRAVGIDRGRYGRRRISAAGLDELGTPSLGGRLAIAEGGLLTRLIAQGEIDDDEAQTVIAELQGLIDRHGEDALAEDLQGNT